MTEKLSYHKIEEIEEEVRELKKEVASKKNVKLKGFWKGLKVDEQDFREAEESLFKRGN